MITGIVVLASVGVANAKKQARQQVRFHESPRKQSLPADLALHAGPSLSSSVADTFHLAWYSFDNNGADPQGWTSVDLTEQDVYFHVADPSELSGGTFGNLLPLSGNRSMWCGSPAPVCSYAGTFPGYGNAWAQLFCTNKLNADSVVITYTVFWQSEPNYDDTRLEWSSDSTNWQPFNVAAGSPYPGRYEGIGPHPGDGETNAYLTESFGVGPATGATLGCVWLRFHFRSDGVFSDEDGLWPTDGAILIDDITVDEYAANGTLLQTTTSTFETAPVGGHADEHGLWNAKTPPPFGDFASLYPGATVVQEDPCFANASSLWGFFTDPSIENYMCHSPVPLPNQGIVPHQTNGLYMRNEIWSPRIPNVGSGDQYMLSFDVYRDLPLENLIFYVWDIRTWNGGCAGPWGKQNALWPVYYGYDRDWYNATFNVSALVSPTDDEIQISLGAYDMCPIWCGVYAFGGWCHSHAPLFDNVHLKRVTVTGPQFVVRHIDLFQDNFAEDGTLTGPARADCANDIAPQSSPTILPGDSVTLTVTTITTDPITGVGPAVYAYIAVWPQGQTGKTGADIEASETRAGIGKRYPLVNTIVHDGVTWYCYRADSVSDESGTIVADKYASDLNDFAFTPGDTICYVFCADDGAGNKRYFSRRVDGQGDNFVTDDLWEALNSPMEFTILPTPGGCTGDLLYVDATDDRGGPAQLYFDSTFDIYGIKNLVDRFDILGPSSAAGNSLASRVKNQITQIRDCYRTIIWCSGDVWSAIGDGTGNPWKSDDYGLLFFLLDTHPNNPGLYLSGDNIAAEWVSLAGTGAVALRAQYLSFNLVSRDHVASGEPVSPLLTGLAPYFAHSGVPDNFVAYGGCPAINNFDLLAPTGTATATVQNLSTGKNYVIHQTTLNAAASIARSVLSGFSYSAIRDIQADPPAWPPARAHHFKDIMQSLQVSIFSPTGIPNGKDVFANRLDNNYPNPFNPTTTIRYSIRSKGYVSLRIYDVTGALVRTLVDEVQTPRAEGFAIEWNGSTNAGSNVASGVYFYRLVTEGFDETKKMVLLK
jgi:hypothetical protein